MLREGDALQLERNVLRAVRTQDDQRLRTLVRDVAALPAAIAWPPASRGAHAFAGGSSLALRRDPLRRPLLVMVAPAYSTIGLHGCAAFDDAVMLVLRDPDRRMVPDIGVVREALGLTRREAELALALQAGDPLSEAAVRIGITEGTARQYLKSVFAKAGVERQSELAVLLRNLA